MRKLIIKIVHPFLNRFAKYYFAKPRKYNYKNIQGIINPEVFHPQFTISTKILLEYLSQENLTNKTFLELGCGSGIISVFAAKNGAKVLASDINVLAIENAILNAKKNKISIETVHSDLFQKIPQQTFDYTIINPPYYPKTPINDKEKAWYCGNDFQYFKALFATIQPYLNEKSKVVMILSEDCEIDTIQQLAKTNNISFEIIFETKKWREKNYLFQLKSV